MCVLLGGVLFFLQDKEVANGGTVPRMLCLDDYFMVETEKVEKDPESGRTVKKMVSGNRSSSNALDLWHLVKHGEDIVISIPWQVMEYEYDPGLEVSYKASFLKSFRRQLDDCYFNFFIVDANFEERGYLEEFWSYAKSKGFQVCVSCVTTGR